VVKPKADTPIDANEIRITSQGRARNYITYAMTLLQVFNESEMCQFTIHCLVFVACWEIWFRVYELFLSIGIKKF
jgi:hypothetical protein